MRIVGNCEYGLLFYRDKLPKFNNKGKMVMNCIDWERDDISSPLIRKIHPTQKPVKLLEKLIEIFTNEGDIVIDPCSGSGSTLVACSNKKRKGFGFEIKKDFYKEAKEWEEEVIQSNKDIEEFGFSKELIKKDSPTLF